MPNVFYRSVHEGSWNHFLNGTWATAAATQNTHDSLVVMECTEGPGSVEPMSSRLNYRAAEAHFTSVFPTSVPHSTDLPPGHTWQGTYLPAVSSSSYDTTANVVSMQSYACPHCAIEAATIVAAANNLPASRRPTVLLVTTQENGRLAASYRAPAHNARLLPEVPGGPLSVGSTCEKSVTLGYGCKLCGFPGHNTRTCTTIKHYDKVGLEIEGRFENLNQRLRDADADGLGSTDDCSISREGTSTTARAREFQTKPGSLIEALRQLVKYYPDEADSSCGLHVHVSFQDETSISQLITQEFYDYFRTRWVAWGEAQGLGPGSTFMRRLMGENDYCQVNRHDPGQNQFTCDRYKQLNFTAWSEHKTVECRMLPMFRSAKMAVAAVTHLLQIYEDWLARDCAVLPLPDMPVTQESVGDFVEGNIFSAVQEIEVCEAEVGYKETCNHSEQLEIAELPPVAPGHRRIVVHGTQLDILRNMGLVA